MQWIGIFRCKIVVVFLISVMCCSLKLSDNNLLSMTAIENLRLLTSLLLYENKSLTASVRCLDQLTNLRALNVSVIDVECSLVTFL